MCLRRVRKHFEPHTCSWYKQWCLTLFYLYLLGVPISTYYDMVDVNYNIKHYKVENFNVKFKKIAIKYRD